MASKCASCRFHGKIHGEGTHGPVYCNYLDIMGRARSLICPPGEQCTEFEPREPGKRYIYDFSPGRGRVREVNTK